jgi:hypothetical protein
LTIRGWREVATDYLALFEAARNTAHPSTA